MVLLMSQFVYNLLGNLTFHRHFDLMEMLFIFYSFFSTVELNVAFSKVRGRGSI